MHRSWIIVGIVILGTAAATLPVAPSHSYATNGFASASGVSKAPFRQVSGWRVVVPGQRTPAFSTPAGLAIDGEGAIYVADTAANRIQKVSPNGKALLAWGGHLDHPGQIAADLHGHIYVVDENHGRLQAFTSTGKLLVSFHPRHSSIAGLDVVADPHGQVYIFERIGCVRDHES